jgi:hypothetical protein
MAKLRVDDLFPSNRNKSGSRGKRLDIETLFINTPLNDDPDLSFNSSVLLQRIEERRKKKLWYYMNMLRYCYDRIDQADDDQMTDILFSVIEHVPDCRRYSSIECLEYISDKLREQKFDTFIINDTTMFITWKEIELKHEDEKNKHRQELEQQKINEQLNKERIERKFAQS